MVSPNVGDVADVAVESNVPSSPVGRCPSVSPSLIDLLLRDLDVTDELCRELERLGVLFLDLDFSLDFDFFEEPSLDFERFDDFFLNFDLSADLTSLDRNPSGDLDCLDDFFFHFILSFGSLLNVPVLGEVSFEPDFCGDCSFDFGVSLDLVAPAADMLWLLC